MLEAQSMFRKFRRQIPEFEITPSKRRGLLGYLKAEVPEIKIAVKLGVDERIVTLLHELYHFNYPDMDEDTVEKESKTMFLGLNPKQKSYLEFIVQEIDMLE